VNGTTTADPEGAAAGEDVVDVAPGVVDPFVVAVPVGAVAVPVGAVAVPALGVAIVLTLGLFVPLAPPLRPVKTNL
jgi:hypothetical protein